MRYCLDFIGKNSQMYANWFKINPTFFYDVSLFGALCPYWNYDETSDLGIAGSSPVMVEHIHFRLDLIYQTIDQGQFLMSFHFV